MFIYEKITMKYVKFRPLGSSNKFIKAIDLRRVKALDGKFLTGVDSTISIIGSKLMEWNIRLF